MLEQFSGEYEIGIALLVELADKRSQVEKFVAGRALQPEAIVYLPPQNRHGHALDPAFLKAIDAIGRDTLWGVIISTEPRAHRVYAAWALCNGLHTLLDKPVTAMELAGHPPETAFEMVSDLYRLVELSHRSRARCLVQTPRRAHPGYEIVKEYLQRFLARFQVPMTYVDLYHADGMWNMPNEFHSRENHPYRYGYGVIMHSGYHMLDLLAWLLVLNNELPETAPDLLELCCRHHRPYDFLAQVGSARYDAMLGAGGSLAPYFGINSMRRLREYGETDVYLLLQYLRGDAVMTTASLSLLQTSFSRRGWLALPGDTYRSNGRVRHERLTVQVGHLLSLQVHSYQAQKASNEITRLSEVGSADHFEVYAFRNSAIVGGPAFERVDLGPASPYRTSSPRLVARTDSGRAGIFADFLAEDDRRASLASHSLPVKVAASAYYAMRQPARGSRSSLGIDLHAERTGWLV